MYMAPVGRPSKPAKTALGKWVRGVREHAGLGVEAFADAVGVNRVTVNSWESGAHGLRWDSIRKIQSAFPHAPAPPIGVGEDVSDARLSGSPARVDSAQPHTGGSLDHTTEGNEVAADLDEIEDRTIRRRARHAAQEAIAKIVEDAHPTGPSSSRGGAARHS